MLWPIVAACGVLGFCVVFLLIGLVEHVESRALLKSRRLYTVPDWVESLIALLFLASAVLAMSGGFAWILTW
jgi:hypothetical protein